MSSQPAVLREPAHPRAVVRWPVWVAGGALSIGASMSCGVDESGLFDDAPGNGPDQAACAAEPAREGCGREAEGESSRNPTVGPRGSDPSPQRVARPLQPGPEPARAGGASEAPPRVAPASDLQEEGQSGEGQSGEGQEEPVEGEDPQGEDPQGEDLGGDEVDPEPVEREPAEEDPAVEPPGDVAPEPPCQPGPFGEPELVGGLGLVGLQLWAPLLVEGGATLLFAASGGATSENIFTADREPASGIGFLQARALSAVNSTSLDGSPFPSADGLRLYFFSTRRGGAGGRDLWISSRASVEEPFGAPLPLSELNTPDEEHLPWLTRDELTIYFATTRPTTRADFNLFQASRASLSEPFGPAQPVANVNSDALEGRGTLSEDALALIFMSARQGGVGREDLWLSRRVSPEVEFDTPLNLTAVNSSAADLDPALSADGLQLFFSSDRGGAQQIWRSVREACLP